MRIKHIIAYTKKGIRVLFPLFLGVLMYYMLSSALTPQGFQLDADGLLSAEMCEQLSDYLNQEIHEGIGIKKLRQHLLQKFPVLCAARLHMMPNQIVLTHVEADGPFLLINDNFVLTRSKKMVTKNTYKEEAVAEVPKIRAASFDPQQTSGWLHDYATFFFKAPPEMYEQFNVSIDDSTRIELRDKKDEGWRLITSSDRLITDQLLKRYEQIKNENRSNKKGGTIDARFEGMLVLSG